MGEGMSPGFFIIVAVGLFSWTIVILGSLGVRPPFAALLIAWNGIVFGSMIYGAVRLGSKMTFRGDAWGVDINLAIIGPLLFGVLLLLSIRWWYHRHFPPVAARVSISGIGKVMLGAALALVPVIVVLFAGGDGVHHTGKDRLAVVCVIAQCLFVGAVLRGNRGTSNRERVEAA